MLIGIDPGKQTGVCVYDTKTKIIVDLYETNFWGLIGLIEIWKDEFFILEKPNSKHVWHEAKTIKHAKVIGANVGSVYREAELIEEYLKLKGYKHKTVHPKGKKTLEEFKLITGYKRNATEHERDAAMLCVNYAWQYYKNK